MSRSRAHKSPVISLYLQADHTVELNPEGLSTGSLLAVAGTHHAHHEKTTGKIGESFPEGGYGTPRFSEGLLRPDLFL